MMKPARRQNENQRPDREAPGQTYNIWYHKNSCIGDQYEDIVVRAPSRCDVMRDSGSTKAAADSYLCVHFIRGECCMGAKCKYFHHLPSQDEIGHIPITKDVFGRDRHATDREDMSGVGNFNKENKTVFIGRIAAKATELYDLLYRHFSEWGEIEELIIPNGKTIAFVRYIHRSSAETAKEGMNNQSLGYGDVLQVKWANEDRNPKRKAENEIHEKEAARKLLFAKVLEKMGRKSSEDVPMNYQPQNFEVPTVPVAENEYLYQKQNIEYENKINEYYNWLNLPHPDDIIEDSDSITKQTQNSTQNDSNNQIENDSNNESKNDSNNQTENDSNNDSKNDSNNQTENDIRNDSKNDSNNQIENDIRNDSKNDEKESLLEKRQKEWFEKLQKDFNYQLDNIKNGNVKEIRNITHSFYNNDMTSSIAPPGLPSSSFGREEMSIPPGMKPSGNEDCERVNSGMGYKALGSVGISPGGVSFDGMAPPGFISRKGGVKRKASTIPFSTKPLKISKGTGKYIFPNVKKLIDKEIANEKC